MRRIYFLSVALWVLLPAALVTAQSSGTHDTGVVRMGVFDNGVIGLNTGSGPGFVHLNSSEQALFDGVLLIAQESSVVYGNPYGPIEYTPESTISPIAPPFAFPFEEFEHGLTASYSIPLGLRVMQRSYSRTTGALIRNFVMLEFTIENTSGSGLDGIYLGVFADWEVGSGLNLAGYEPDLQLLYVYDDIQVSPRYYGVVALNGSVSGWAESPGLDDVGLFTALTTMGSISGISSDRYPVLETGPYSIPTGESVPVRLAFLYGADLPHLIDNAHAARSAAAVAIELGPNGLPGTHNLSSVYPNPFNPHARFTLEIADQQVVRIAVYDALGREVALIHEGNLSAGSSHAFEIDGTGLPSGIYMIQATGDHFVDTRRITVLK